MDINPDFDLVCWVDSVRGIELMSSTLATAGAQWPVDVCVEVGMPGGRTGCQAAGEVDAVARAAADSGQLRLVGVAGYEAATVHDTSREARDRVRAYLRDVRGAVDRVAPMCESDEVIVTAGGSTYFDVVADELTGWADDRAGRPDYDPRSRCGRRVVSRPEPDLALVTMGRRDGVEVGTWLEFGVSRPCTVFDKWQMIPVLDGGGRVVEFVRTFF